MTREEITKRIEQIENSDFMLQMKDFWDWKDRKTHWSYQSELMTLRKQLKEMGE